MHSAQKKVDELMTHHCKLSSTIYETLQIISSLLLGRRLFTIYVIWKKNIENLKHGIVYEFIRVDHVFVNRTFTADRASVATVMRDGESLNLH